jgi:hypothetical protein
MATVSADGVGLSGEFAFDQTRRSLTYAVRVNGVPAARVFALSIDRDSAGRKGPIILQLSGPGLAQTKGSVTLADTERRDLLAGRMALVVYTTDRPAGAAKAPMLLPAGSGIK